MSGRRTMLPRNNRTTRGFILNKAKVKDSHIQLVCSTHGLRHSELDRTVNFNTWALDWDSRITKVGRRDLSEAFTKYDFGFIYSFRSKSQGSIVDLTYVSAALFRRVEDDVHNDHQSAWISRANRAECRVGYSGVGESFRMGHALCGTRTRHIPE